MKFYTDLNAYWDDCPDDGVETKYRLLKLSEEVGEICGAYISFTDPVNKKNITLQNVISEIADTQIVLWDFLRKLADDCGMDRKVMEQVFNFKIEQGLDNFKRYLEKRDKLREEAQHVVTEGYLKSK